MRFVPLFVLASVVLSAPVDDYVVQFRKVLTSFFSESETNKVLLDFMNMILKNRSSEIFTMSGGGNVLVSRAALKMASAFSIYNKASDCFKKAGGNIDDYVERVGGKAMGDSATKLLKMLDQNNAKYTASGMTETNRRGKLFIDAKNATTVAFVKEMTTNMMKGSTQKEWTCTCTYLTQVFTGMKAHTSANCQKTA